MHNVGNVQEVKVFILVDSSAGKRFCLLWKTEDVLDGYEVEEIRIVPFRIPTTQRGNRWLTVGLLDAIDIPTICCGMDKERDSVG